MRRVALRAALYHGKVQDAKPISVQDGNSVHCVLQVDVIDCAVSADRYCPKIFGVDELDEY